LEFSDGLTRQSNVFTKTQFAAEYKVTVYADTMVEAAGLFLAQRKTIGFGEALLVSFVLNTASFGIGLIFPF